MSGGQLLGHKGDSATGVRLDSFEVPFNFLYDGGWVLIIRGWSAIAAGEVALHLVHPGWRMGGFAAVADGATHCLLITCGNFLRGAMD